MENLTWKLLNASALRKLKCMGKSLVDSTFQKEKEAWWGGDAGRPNFLGLLSLAYSCIKVDAGKA